MGRSKSVHSKSYHIPGMGGSLIMKRRLDLLRHLRKTRVHFSAATLKNLLEEDTRKPIEVVEDLLDKPSGTHVGSSEHEGCRSETISDDTGIAQWPSKDTESDEPINVPPPTISGDSTDSVFSEFSLPSISDVEEDTLKRYYNTFLNSTRWQVSNLYVKPGDNNFVLWFFMSSYVPLICSCSGPLSNMFSLFAIVCPWKITTSDPSFKHDPFWCYLVNSISIIFGLVSNVFLVLNYRKKLHYNICQTVSIICWLIASIILTILIIAYHVLFYQKKWDEDHVLGYGFWFAIVTVILHFANFVLLLLNELGFVLKKYKPVFNIDEIQETLIIQVMFLVVWLIIGSTIFTRFLYLSLGESLYYCIVSIVTIGAQQYVQVTHSAAATLTAIWIVVGLVMFGLIISSIREMIIIFSSSTMYWHRLESLRKYVYRNHEREQEANPLTSPEFYSIMKNVDSLAYAIQGAIALALSIIIFIITLMCGALGFSLYEHWSYSSSCYFCFFSLITLGQGNQSPQSPGGRVFFCVWAMAAIPVMTILVATSSDFVYSQLTSYNNDQILEALTEFCLNHKWLRKLGKWFKGDDFGKPVDTQGAMKFFATSSFKVIPTREKKKRGLPSSGFNDNADSDDNDIDNSDLDIDNVPLLSHPVDMLASVLMDAKKIDGLNFITSKDFFKSNTLSIHLANYYREGLRVDFDPAKIYESRTELIHRLRQLDSNLDVPRFKEVYNFSNSLSKDGIDPVGVVQPDHIIRTRFKKKNDYILKNLSVIQILIIEIKRASLMMSIDKNFKYPFEEWDKFFKLTRNCDYKQDPFFWISSTSPLAFPLYQPRYLMLHYLRYLDIFLQRFALEYDSMDTNFPHTKTY